jgi:hypothetical protein
MGFGWCSVWKRMRQDLLPIKYFSRQPVCWEYIAGCLRRKIDGFSLNQNENCWIPIHAASGDGRFGTGVMSNEMDIY